VYKYHIFLIYWSVVGHGGCSHNLTIMNSAAINVGVQSHIPLGISLGVVLLDSMTDLFLVFHEDSTMFSIVFVLAYIPISNV
jgi:hypothetical protein